MERLPADLLRREQEKTLASPRMEYGVLALEREPFASMFEADYGRSASLADVFRQIGYDERVHKEESLACVAEPRLS